jgi:hypothetical protein
LKPDTADFASRVDAWLAAIIVVSAVASLFVAGALLMSDVPARMPLAVVLAAIGGVLPLWVMAATRYIVGLGELRIVSGPFRWRVPLREIRAVTPTRNPLSSPALSLDRLRIEYGRRKWIMVSPRDRQAFVSELRRRGAPIDEVATRNR